MFEEIKMNSEKNNIDMSNVINKLFEGDCLEYMKKIPDGSVDFRDLRKLHELLHVSGGDCADLFRTVFCSDTPLPLPAGTARREKVLTVPPTGIGGQISEP